MSVEAPQWVGVTLGNGRYRVRSQLGAGGMGFVLLADDLRLRMPVVVKVPRPAMLLEAGFAARFAREIQSMIQLAHPRIVRILDVGEHDKLPFAVMQYLAGGSLKNLLGKDRASLSGRVCPERPQTWLGPVAETLDFIHAEGYLHRDIKPDNILFDERGHPFLSDFGVAKVLSGAQAEHQTAYTREGMPVGTPQYMAPEMILGLKLDGRVDQYALAVTLYECLSGRLPFNGPNPTAIFLQQLKEKAPALAEIVPGLPPGLSEAVARAMDKNAKLRFASCTDFADAVLQTLGAPQKPSEVVKVKPRPPSIAPDKPDLVRMDCPNCGQAAKAPVAMIGRRVRCPSCGTSLGRLAAPARRETSRGSHSDTPGAPALAPYFSWGKTLLWAGVGLLLALGAGVVYFLASKPIP